MMAILYIDYGHIEWAIRNLDLKWSGKDVKVNFRKVILKVIIGNVFLRVGNETKEQGDKILRKYKW
jgi:hypothetical protein